MVITSDDSTQTITMNDDCIIVKYRLSQSGIDLNKMSKSDEQKLINWLQNHHNCRKD